MRHSLLLWDIDGTLLYSGGVAGACMRAAMEQVYGRAPGTDRQLYAGRTDQQIIFELFATQPQSQLVERFEPFVDAYLEALRSRQGEFLTRGYVLPGARALLTALQRQPVVQSVVTGNHRRVARFKLELMGLSDLLDLDSGAYGDDHYQRSRLPTLAAERASRRYGQVFAGHDVVVIGDTPHDIECGLAFGARTVAVASGAYTMEALRAHHPDALLPALEPVGEALAAILGPRAPAPAG